MSETATSTASDASGDPGSDPAATGGAPPAAPPAGYVPLSEVEKAREDARRASQAAEDLRRELARLKAPAATGEGKGDSGFDPDSFKQSLLRDVFGATQVSQAASQLKSEFPHADPSLFDPEKLSQYGSADALRFEVEASHRRVAGILEAERQAIEQKVREELASKFGDGGAGNAGGTPPVAGDLTPAQLAAMTPAEMDALERQSPGIIDRILGRRPGVL